MVKLLVVVLAALTSSCYGDERSKEFLRSLPWETRDILLQLQPHLRVQRLTESPVPLYRPDMGEEAAYWMITYNDNEYAIVSAGLHTGDNVLVFQGEGESPLKMVQQKAAEKNARCHRYHMLTPAPGMTLGCDTEQGQVTERELDAKQIPTLWRKHQQKAAERRQKVHDVKPSSFFPITSGHPGAFLDAGMRAVYIRPANGSDYMSTRLLCVLLGVCGEGGRVHVFEETEYGEEYLHLEPVQADLVTHDIPFEVVGESENHGVVVRRFVLEPYHRARRQSVSHSIDHVEYMPNYNQFKISSCDYVGCGPVAWAQVFGYYDIRAQHGVGRTVAQALYRCGTDGTTGSDTCQAPANMHTDVTRIDNYITKMHDLLGTFCLFGNGATYQSHMDDIADFFKQRSGSGNIILNTHGNFLTQLIGSYDDSIRDKSFSYVRARWPVVVGFRVDGIFSQHYAVMTEYRQRTVSTASGSEIEYDMNLHMGWGGSGNGWRKAEMFMAAVAEY